MSADAETMRVYAAQADRYDAIPQSQKERESLDVFLARLPAGARILDLGCGPGHQAARMQAAAFSVTAWDACPAFVAAARARGVDACERVFDDLAGVAGFEAVWASFSLLHARRADLPRHLADIARALTSRGWLYLGMKTGQGEARDGLGRHYCYVTASELAALVNAAGFSVIDMVEDSARGLAGTDDPFILMTCRKDA